MIIRSRDLIPEIWLGKESNMLTHNPTRTDRRGDICQAAGGTLAFPLVAATDVY